MTAAINQIQSRDANGRLRWEENEDGKMVPVWEAAAEFIRGVDNSGVWWMRDGDPKLTRDEVLEFSRISYLLLPKDEDGNVLYKRDEDGNVVYRTDEEGRQLEDENGNPIPEYADFVRRVQLLDAETQEPYTVELIKGADLRYRLGHCGGRQRVNWEGMQPIHHWERVVKPLMESAGIKLEGIFWLEDRLVMDCVMPNVAGLDFGDDEHTVRVAFILDYSGSGSDKVVISMTRTVCANTVHVATMQAESLGSIFRLRHAKGIQDRWEIDGRAFVDAAANGVSQYFSMITAAKGAMVDTEAKRARVIDTLLGEKPHVDETTGFMMKLVTGKDGKPKLENGAPVFKPVKKNGKYVNGRSALTRYNNKRKAFINALVREQKDAAKTGIDPNSVRIYWEAYTRLWNHGDTTKDEKTGQEVTTRPLFNAQTDGAVRDAIYAGKLSSDPLGDLLREAGLLGLEYDGADLSLEAAGIAWNSWKDEEEEIITMAASSQSETPILDSLMG